LHVLAPVIRISKVSTASGFDPVLDLITRSTPQQDEVEQLLESLCAE
jgi:hypothetical protein